MKKKILFISEALWIGGIETALVNLLNRMDYEQYDVTCLVVRGSLELADRITPKCRLLVADRERTFTFSEKYRYSRLYHLAQECRHPSRLHRAMMWAVPAVKWLENRLYIRYIRRQMGGEKFDTCVIYSDRTAEIAVRAIRADRYLLFYHHGAMRSVYHDTIGYHRAEKVVAVSDAVAQKLRAYRPAYAGKMTAVNNLTDVEGIQMRAAETVPETFRADRFHIVTCGRISHEKGMDLAVEACARLVAMGHENIHWWLVGGGPAEQEIRAKIAQTHMEDHVTMLGMRENPYPYMRQADLYVQPSRYESYGLTIAEAMVLNRPIVSTDTDGIRIFARIYDRITLCECDAEHIAQSIHAAMNAAPHPTDPVAAIHELNQAAMNKFTALL